jgi:hypothetical protein
LIIYEIFYSYYYLYIIAPVTACRWCLRYRITAEWVDNLWDILFLFLFLLLLLWGLFYTFWPHKIVGKKKSLVKKKAMGNCFIEVRSGETHKNKILSLETNGHRTLGLSRPWPVHKACRFCRCVDVSTCGVGNSGSGPWREKQRK